MKLYFFHRFMFFEDIRLFFYYFFINPYRTVRKFLQKKGEKNPYQYGESPILEIEKLIELAGGILPYQHFGDLGAGRGRVCNFVQKKYGCKVFAFEQVAIFGKIAKKLFPQVRYIIGDFLEKDFSSLDIIYFYGTMMKEKQILDFVQKVKGKTIVISISYPLNVYDSRFKTINSCELNFPWGKTKGYIQCLRR